MKRLVIISHTEHYQLDDGRIVGFGPTVTEINHLLDLFDTIDHVAMLHRRQAPAHAVPYDSDRIQFVPLPALGGKGLMAKLRLLSHAWAILKTLRKTLKAADYFQFRGPTGIGVFVVPYLIFGSRKKGWFKYAGHWKQTHAPLAYRWQRWLFSIQKRPVTINGHWDQQPKHCFTFENPCLTNAELQDGQKVVSEKVFDKSAIQLCFVGRLEPEKGIQHLIDALKALPIDQQRYIHKVHIVGEGPAMDDYQQQVENCGIDFKFYGLLPRAAVHAIYKRCHAIVLPSASEGFPKVIAEAMNYGCIPLVSNVSAIGQYVKDDENGFLLSSVSMKGVSEVLTRFFHLETESFQALIQAGGQKAKLFSYAYYHERLSQYIISS